MPFIEINGAALRYDLSGSGEGAKVEVLPTAHFMSQQTPELVAQTMLRFLESAGT